MPDIYSIHAMQKFFLIKRLFDGSNRRWKALSWSLLALQKDLLDFKLNEGNYQVAKTKFYQQVLNSWFSIKTKRPQSVNEILNEYLVYNRYIQVNKSCVK